MNKISQEMKHRRIINIIFVLVISYPILLFADSYGPIDISVSISRVSGVAPLSVFFDATNTKGLTDNGFFSGNAAYMDATFAWDFDADNNDPDGKYEKASGFVAAHVFEHPGSYRVHLDVYDAAGKIASKDINITVSAFSGTTYYVADNGSDFNSGLTMDAPFLTTKYALTGPHIRPNTRILFKNGDTFKTPFFEHRHKHYDGPVIIDSYKDPDDPSSAKPLIYSTGANGAYAVFTLDTDDWRVMNLAVRSGGTAMHSSPRYPGGINFGPNTTNNLKYRTTEYYLAQVPMGIGGTYNTIAECEFYNVNGGAYSSTQGGNPNDGNCIIGNYLHDQSGDHVGGHTFRLQGGSRFFIAHNTFGPNILNVSYDALTIRGNSKKVIIYKNTFYGWVQSFRPQNANSTPAEYVHHCTIDSNLFIGQNGGAKLTALQISAKDIVIRNNIIYNYQYLVSTKNDTVVGAAQRIKAYNNTFLNPTASNTFYVFDIDQPCSNFEFKNNLMLDVAGSSQFGFIIIEDGTTLSNCVSDKNMFYGSSWGANSTLFDGSTLARWQSSTGNDKNSSISNPLLLSTDYNNTNFCKPKASSPVVDAGKFTPGALDYNGNLRDNSRDIGACEYTGRKVSKQIKKK